jgi:hypothetical protein
MIKLLGFVAAISLIVLGGYLLTKLPTFDDSHWIIVITEWIFFGGFALGLIFGGIKFLFKIFFP